MARRKNSLQGQERFRRTRNLALLFTSQHRQFLTHCRQKNLTQRTIETYDRYLKSLERYLLSVGHSTLVTEIDKALLENYILTLKDVAKLSPYTVNSAIRHLKVFFSFLVENEVIEVSPMAKIKKLRIDEEPPQSFSDEQVMILLKQPDKSTFTGYRDYLMMSMLLGTGMRISELLNLRVGDINLKEGSILIRLAKARRSRVVGIPKAIRSEIERYFKLCFDKISPEMFVFQTIDGRQMNVRLAESRIKSYGQKAKIRGIRCSPHTFRRTFAINYLKNGGSTASLRRQLGHSSIQTVERYLYWTDSDVLAEHEKYNPVDRFLRG